MQALKVAGCIPPLLYSQLFVHIPYPTSDFSGQTIIVTGSNTGLGKEAVRHLVRLGSKKVIMGVRTVSKGEAAAEDIINSCNVKSSIIEVWQLDMADSKSVQAFAERARGLERLDAAILNAGVQSMKWSTAGSYESHIAINTINTTLLSMLLLPKLQASARTTGQRGRLTTVGSDLMYFANLRELETEGNILKKLSDEAQSRSWIGQRYAQSKILLFWLIRELANRNPLTQDSDVLITVVTPGGCQSDLFRDDIGPVGKAVFKFISGCFNRTTEVGARTYVHAVSPELPVEAHGRFLMDAKIAANGMNVTSVQGRNLAKKWNEEMLEMLQREVDLDAGS
ncbi:hypothetical protein M409DRAFT_16723 [Zasmidium cellare ATCC 36951]|uniref:Ketoreductase (KR) domain-containing protein n=1 Tax=Zasmidium cellare ATCC 36951 TaxID=1080233 RepID=A0A6A6D2V1_ZASCE|nr:uncharacterized protein M409DRAFT_16723 [Zasmidium cellare ATCC 36951]KAF2172758.1 hypothetical protein M409DRAFT_16723 [Zasmidium cellare ATCC 36951]